MSGTSKPGSWIEVVWNDKFPPLNLWNYRNYMDREYIEPVNGRNVAITNVNKTDMVNHPPHYTSHPSGVECIQITEHMGFNLGNAMKYIWRADLKVDAIEDMKKAVFYINREIQKRESK